MIRFTVTNMISFEPNHFTIIPTIEIENSKACTQVMFKLFNVVWNQCYVKMNK